MLTEAMTEPLRSPLLEAAAGIRHGYFTRRGGVSQGIYGSLNIGTGSADDPRLVAANRRRVADWLGVPTSHLLSVHQIHSPDVIVAREPFDAERPRADAIVTDRPGLAVGASSADCGPVLFADPRAGVVGAAHAGWKGALTGVLENTVSAMQRLGASKHDIVAVLGPSISARNYEVGPEFVARFVAADPANAVYFADAGTTPGTTRGHSMFDLARYTVDRLARTGVQAAFLDRCTYAEEDLFFSYRRATHRGEADYGRQISAIVLEE